MGYVELLLISSSIAGMITDITQRRISNSLCFLIFSLCLAMGLLDSSLQFHLYQVASVVAIGFGLFALGILGAGDTKLFSAYALIIDETYFLFTLLIISVLGAITAVALLVMQRVSKNKNKHRRGVPYGIPIVVASLFGIYLSKLN